MAIDLSQFAGQFSPEVIQGVQAFMAAKPDQERVFLEDYGGDLGTWLNAFQSWFNDNGHQIADKLDQFPAELGLLGALGYEVNPQAIPAGAPGSTTGALDTTGGGTPLEQGLLQGALPGLLADVNNDANRRKIADNLGQTVIGGANAAATQLARAQGGHFDGRNYFAQNQDVANAFNGLADGTQPGTKNFNGQDVTADQFAEYHFLNFGQREGRQPSYVQSAQLAQDFNNADRTTQANIAANNQAFQTQLGALQNATSALQQNLSGELAARAGALQQQIASLGQNIDQLDASQRKALTDQIASMQANLEQSVATQRQALQEQLVALGNAATADAQAKRAALQQEIAGLTAAQAPLADARTKAAELQATSINLGLERTRDQLTAEAAKAGYMGGSTFQDAALARATIDARQRAAGAASEARLANAADTRDIGVRGAMGERSIADALSSSQRGVAERGANENYGLTSTLAQGRRQIGDYGASGTAAIANNTALARKGVGDYGANTTYGDSVYGAQQGRSISDALAQGTYGLTSTNAQQNQQANLQGNAAKATYYDNDYNRSLSASLAMPGVATNATNALTSLDNYANSGLGRTLNTLGWWSTNQSAAPTPGMVAVQPDTTGNSLANLGAGLTSAGLQAGIGIGNANNWWQTPKVPTKSVAPGGINAGGSNLYTSPLT